MHENQDLIQIEPVQNYIARHINLRVIPNKENILSANFYNGYSTVSRIFDILFSLILLVIFIVSIPFVWLFNLSSSPGPLFYKQIRVGKNGKNFTIYKFRSMKVDAEADGIPRFTKENDSRITTVGSILRKTRIDELPQVINILRGEMTLIGPRPERPEFVSEFIRQEPRYELRSLVKPGITGWGQVKYKYTSTLEEGLKKLDYDLYFMKHRSFYMDLTIILRTIYIVVCRTGT